MTIRAGLLCFAIGSLASPALAQGVQGTLSPTGVSYQTSPMPVQPKPVENIGRRGQFIFGIERVTGLFFDRQRIDYTDQVSGQEYEHTFKSTRFALLGMSSTSPSSLPRFALDYSLLYGITVGGSFALSTHGLSIDGEGGQRPAPPPTAAPDGTTVLFHGRAGFAYAFDQTFAIWPRAGLSYSSTTAEIPAIDPLTGLSAASFHYSARFGTVNLELLLAVSPIKHVVVLGGPYLDLGLGGRYSLEDSNGDEIDRRSASLTSFGLLVHAAGYY